jgi:hypothetical protein
MTILNMFLVSKSCDGNITHKTFQEVLIYEWIIYLREGSVTASSISRGRPSPFSSQLSSLEMKHSQYWPCKENQRWCCVWMLKKQARSTLYFCKKCEVGVFVANCFEKWRILVNL